MNSPLHSHHSETDFHLSRRSSDDTHCALQRVPECVRINRTGLACCLLCVHRKSLLAKLVRCGIASLTVWQFASEGPFFETRALFTSLGGGTLYFRRASEFAFRRASEFALPKQAAMLSATAGPSRLALSRAEQTSDGFSSYYWRRTRSAVRFSLRLTINLVLSIDLYHTNY
jgi:hypothetical protein